MIHKGVNVLRSVLTVLPLVLHTDVARVVPTAVNTVLHLVEHTYVPTYGCMQSWKHIITLFNLQCKFLVNL